MQVVTKVFAVPVCRVMVFDDQDPDQAVSPEDEVNDVTRDATFLDPWPAAMVYTM